MDEARRGPARRCPSCRARLRTSQGKCQACGAAVPWRLTGVGIAVEGVAALVVAVGIIALVLFWRGRSAPGDVASRPLFEGVISERPTEPATFTPSPLSPPTMPPSTPFPPTATPLPPVIDYSVQSGDTLYGIAIDHGVSLDDILEANSDTLESAHSLSIGQVLRIPIRSAASIAEPIAEAVAESEVTDEGEGAEESSGSSGADTEQAAAPSGEPAPSDLTGGEAPAAPSAPPAELITLRDATTYTILRGDTLGRIAVEHGVPVDDLIFLNGLSGPSAILAVGEELIIEPAIIATAAPTTPTTAAVKPAMSASIDVDRIAALPDDEIGGRAPDFPKPIELAPLDGSLVNTDTAVLRWVSVGHVPFGVYYVVEIVDVDEGMEDVDVIWVRTDATGLRVPARFRPALGASRRLAWRVSVRREGSFLADRRVQLSPPGEWIAFEWSPGGEIDTGPVGGTPSAIGTNTPAGASADGTP